MVSRTCHSSRNEGTGDWDFGTNAGGWERGQPTPVSDPEQCPVRPRIINCTPAILSNVVPEIDKTDYTTHTALH